MVSGFDNLDVHLPATIDVQLVIYLQGGTCLPEDGQFTYRLPTAFVGGPSLFPRWFRVEPGSRFIAATFRPAGFVACFGIPANLLSEQLVPLDAIAERGITAALVERLSLAAEGQHQLLLEDFLLTHLRQASLRKTQPMLPALPLDRLLLPTSELAGALFISARQLERRFLVHHGMPLRDYRRLARFSTALATLMQAAPQATSLSRAAQDARYADQAHFTRDFRQFVGDTPGRFVKSRSDSNSIYRLWQLGPEELAAFMH
ncbi:helix-turn-helix domain-containing protein [Noviherbaspirillum sp.]|uniref:helix-turn-helix domain-containing protein n=1 Tax=Noviherbaspirillum sp. TaxID=1926288 RepID=UPI0039C9CEE2